MDKGKGTARERDPDVDVDIDIDNNMATGSPGPPLMSRMADSVSTLSRTLVAGPPSSDVLSQLGGVGEKRTASGSGSGSGSGSSSSRPEPLVHMRACPSAGAAGAGTVRTTSTHEHVVREDAAFSAFLEGSSSSSSSSLGISALREQERRDGQDVVALLSALDDEQSPARDEAAPPNDDDDMAYLGRALFGDKASSTSTSTSTSTPASAVTDWDHMLNFTPSYLGPGHDGADAARDEAAQHLGTRNLDEARRVWADQWRRVLDSYQDDVWGHLAHLMRDARTEVAALAAVRTIADGPPPEPKALLRLRSILGHLRGF